MRFDILTLFPEVIESVLTSSIIGRARKKGIIQVNCVQIRDFAYDKHRQVDDYPYGGGLGMIMQPQPIYDAYKSVCKSGEKPYTVYLSPQGKTFRQSTAKRLSKKEHIVLLCGHYEGVDQRVIDEIADCEISVGDFVLTGGEIAAMAVVDATARLVPGVLKGEESFSDESFYNGLLEYPQYTRPEVWNDKRVPEVLLSGHHKNICLWKRKMSILNTFNKKRSMLAKAGLSDEEKEFVKQLKEK